ncbi:unnamed protein product, partial [Leptidea sinapis]
MKLFNKKDTEKVAAKEKAVFYIRDVYFKDLKYLSPKIDKGNPNERKSLGLFAKLWWREVMKGFKQFLYEGSLHGVKYIFEPSFSPKERMVWIIIIVISITMCAMNIIQLISKWTSTPFVNVIDSLPTPIWAIPFPTVVLCPHVHVKLSYKNMSELTNLQKFFASLVCPHMLPEQFATPSRMTEEESKLMLEFIVKTVVRSSLSLYSQNMAFVMPSTTCHLEEYEGYPKVFPPVAGMIPYRVMASGEANGILIRSPTDHVYSTTILRLPMDKMTTIEVTPTTYKTDASLRALLPDLRQCFFQNERKLQYFESLVHYTILSNIQVVEQLLIYAYYKDSDEQRQHHQASSSCYPSCNDVLYSSQ